MTALKLVPHAVHPSVFILEEMAARGWTLEDLARRCGGDYGLNHVAIDFYLTIGAETPDLRMGVYAVECARVFGVDRDLFVNLERAWLEETSAVRQ